MKKKRVFLSFSTHSFFLKFRKTNDTAGKFNFYACFLRVNLMTSAVFDWLLQFLMPACVLKLRKNFQRASFFFFMSFGSHESLLSPQTPQTEGQLPHH